MAISIKLFQSVQKSFNEAGFIAPESNRDRCTLSRKNQLHLCSLGLLLVSTSTFFLFEANSVYELGASYTGTNVANIILLFLIVFLYKMRSVLELIDRYELFVQKSKIWNNQQKKPTNANILKTRLFIFNETGLEYKPEVSATYIELSETIETISSILNFLITKFVYVPLLLLSLGNYYFSVQGDASFYLPFPVLYVFWVVFWFQRFTCGWCKFLPILLTFQGYHLIGRRHSDIWWHGLLRRQPLIRQCSIWIWWYPFWSDRAISSSAPWRILPMI